MIVASDPTAAAVLDVIPCIPVPPSGRSPAIDELRARRSGHGFIVGRDGMMLVLNRPWLALDALVTSEPACHVPYGSIGSERMVLACGLIPPELLTAVLDHFTAALPNEAGAFILWDEATGEFSIDFPEIEQASPSRLVYGQPHPPHGVHVVCDLHSHARGAAFFSRTDDADDAHATKIAVVVGQLDRPEGPTFAARLCAGGMYLPLTRLPFAEASHEA